MGYSIKNIPIPSEKSYLMQLVEKIEAVIKRMRLKATFFEKDDEDEEQEIPERYGLISECCPTQLKELMPFENELIQLVERN